jgi:hypothetical protein
MDLLLHTRQVLPPELRIFRFSVIHSSTNLPPAGPRRGSKCRRLVTVLGLLFIVLPDGPQDGRWGLPSAPKNLNSWMQVGPPLQLASIG